MLRAPGDILALAVAALTLSAFAEDVQTADARQVEADDGYYVLFVSQRVAPEEPVGAAIVALGSSDAPDSLAYEFAYGMLMGEDGPSVGKVDVEAIEAMRERAVGEPVKTFIVRVDAEQYATVRGLIDRWIENPPPPGLTPEAELHEAARQIVIAIGTLKEPYRSGGRRAPDGQRYFEDLATLNRNL